MSAPAPSPDELVRFLVNLQRLLAEGPFVATYKYALLLALADLAAEHGHDTGDSLNVSTRRLAEKFIHYYWRQCPPYAPLGRSKDRFGVLRQNTGRQAGIVTLIAQAKRRYADSEECHVLRVGWGCVRRTCWHGCRRPSRNHGAPEYVRRDNGPELIAWIVQRPCARGA